MKTVGFRLKPGQDLKREIENCVRTHNITAGYIVSCVGGLESACVRMAGAKPKKQDIRTFSGDYEIVSLVGTLSADSVHLHMSFSDQNGVVLGGHLKEGTIIDPTAEIIIGYEPDVIFARSYDEATGFDELEILEA